MEERVLGRKGRTSGAVKTAVAETIVEFSNGDCFYLLEKINKQATTITTTKKRRFWINIISQLLF